MIPLNPVRNDNVPIGHLQNVVSHAKRIAMSIAACAFVFIALQSEAIGQWRLATGFSNANAFNVAQVDGVFGITTWGDSLLAYASCVISSNDPGATFDSLSLSTDHGRTWTNFAPNGGFPLVAVGNNFVGSAELALPANTHIVLSYSSDHGQTWKVDTAGWNIPGGNGSARSLVTIGNTIFASNGGGVYKQTAPGAIWTVDTNGIGLGFGIGSVSDFGVLAASGNTLFLSTFGGGVFVSTNKGSSWSSANNGLPTFTSFGYSNFFETYLFAVSGSSVFAAVAHDTGTYGGGDDFDTLDFYVTTNGGQSWSKTNSSLQTWGHVHGFVASGQNLFIAADSGFYYSTNRGSTWTQGDGGLHLIKGDWPTSVQISGGNVVIGTQYGGAWYRSLSDFGISSVAVSGAPDAGLNLTLSENPTSGSVVKIIYTLPNASVAQVMLMDQLGRSVRMLQNGYAISGENTIALDPQSLTQGMYFVRVEASGMSAMQKLVITR